MALTKAQKQKIVEDLREKIAKSQAIILVGITGLKVKDLAELRNKLKAINANIKIAKKTLVEIVCKEKKLDFDKNKFKEEVALVFACPSEPSAQADGRRGFQDSILPAKIIYQFSQENEKMKILGGYLENKFKEAEEIIALAQLPTKEELLARLVGVISAPVSNFVNVLEGNIKGLIRVLTQVKT